MLQSFSDPMVPVLTVGAAVSFAICASSNWLGRLLGVMAFPDDVRRLHKTATPQTGGLAILSGLFVALAVMGAARAISDSNLSRALLISASIVGLVGLLDDRTEVRPALRIFLLLVALGLALSLDPALISSQLNWKIAGSMVISPWVYVPLIAVAFVGIVNAANMADGQDGIAGSMFVAWSLCLAIVSAGEAREIAALLCTFSAIVLLFNLRGRLFLGDCGSFGVTFVLGLLVTLAHARGQLSLETTIVWFFVPVVDCLRLFAARLHGGRSPFDGDRDHIHHRLEALVGKPRGLGIYASVVAVSSLTATIRPDLDLPCIAALALGYAAFIWGAGGVRIIGKFLAEPEIAKVPVQEFKPLQLKTFPSSETIEATTVQSIGRPQAARRVGSRI